ncbi:hypothetical protein BDV41DRAFT_538594 [Aspergillus transmontanensis]|uniref:Uncharacterized protein n=1 Tax=Aspergillus transmontanensis TaxID=1034304 RepID=A0A5N6VWG5_9EURO|nr:hypothetical protein BDV41DRAFT_538594 [Aspergillus transmontanensis]
MNIRFAGFYVYCRVRRGRTDVIGCLPTISGFPMVFICSLGVVSSPFSFLFVLY